MSERDRDVSTRGGVEMVRGGRTRLERILRWMGAVSLGYPVVMKVATDRAWTLPEISANVLGAAMSAGFLIGGRWLHLGIAGLVGLWTSIWLSESVSHMMRATKALQGGELISYWMGELRNLLPLVVAMGCGVVLFVMGKRRR